MDFLLCAITYKCNSRCSFCDIWKKPHKKELEPEDYKKLPFINTINITGGEPFLRNDIVQIVKILQKKSKRIVISTNGFLTKQIVEQVRKMPKVGVRVSIDGINEIHDKLRGIKGGFNKAIKTIKLLKKNGLKDLGIGFTSSEQNIGELLKAYNLSKKLNVQFTNSIAHDSDIYFGKNKKIASNKEVLINELKVLRKKQLFSLNPKNWFRSYFIEGLIWYIKGKAFELPCYAGKESFYLDPYGNVYPCNVLDMKLGNIREDKLNKILGSKEINLKSCKKCWMVCRVGPSMKKNKLKVIKRIICNYL